MHRVRLLRLLLKLPTGFSLLATLGFGMMAATTVTNRPLHWDFGRIPLVIWPAQPVSDAQSAEQAASSAVSYTGGLHNWLGLPAPPFFGAVGNKFASVPARMGALSPRSELARAKPRRPDGVGSPPHPTGEEPIDGLPAGPVDPSGASASPISAPTGGAAPLPPTLLTAGGTGPLLAAVPVGWDGIQPSGPPPPQPALMAPSSTGSPDDGPGPVAEYLPPASALVFPALPGTPPEFGPISLDTVGAVPEPRGLSLFALALFCLLAVVKHRRSSRT